MKIKTKTEISPGAQDALDPQKQVEKILEKFSEQVLKLEGTIRETSPVDKGDYKKLWWTKFSSGGRIAEIINPQKYAPYLIFGTRKIEGANVAGRISFSRKAIQNRAIRYPRADYSRGILHDVRAIIYEWKEQAADVLKRDEP